MRREAPTFIEADTEASTKVFGKNLLDAVNEDVVRGLEVLVIWGVRALHMRWVTHKGLRITQGEAVRGIQSL